MSIPFSHFFQKINQIAPLESDFTEVLDTIAVKPKTLYFYGKMPQNVVKNGKQGPGERPKTVAIVGARKCTNYGREVAYRLAYELAQRGVVVVSGLAYGIDAAAHKGAVEAGGVTVAVLGTPIDQVQPSCNLWLATKIIETGGAVMSEYAPGEQVIHRVSFLERNRLISGLADAVVVVEAAVKSGALNTAMHALDQGRDLFAVPGDITRLMSMGCNRLIKQGAEPYTGVDDVLGLLFPAPRRRCKASGQTQLLIGDTDEETLILQALTKGLRDGEQIIEVTGMAVAIFNQTITMLQIKGRVRALGANRWTVS